MDLRSLVVLVLTDVVLVVLLTRSTDLGEVCGQERGVPDALEVVLGFAQIQGEGVVEEPESGQCLLQAVDRAGGGFEVVVQVGGGGVLGGSLGQQPPLFAFAVGSP